jgi:Rap1a immunity proteins
MFKLSDGRLLTCGEEEMQEQSKKVVWCFPRLVEECSSIRRSKKVEMPQMRIIWRLSFCLVLWSNPAEAQFTGKDLLTWCTSAPATVEFASCALYIAGFIAGSRSAIVDPTLFCLPKEVNGMDGHEVFVRIMNNLRKRGIADDANPFMSGPADAVLAAALGIEYKCKKK